MKEGNIHRKSVDEKSPTNQNRDKKTHNNRDSIINLAGTVKPLCINQNTLQAKWVFQDNRLMKWDKVLDGIQWFHDTTSQMMCYQIINDKIIKPSMLASFRAYENHWAERNYFVSASPFGDIYSGFDASIVPSEEVAKEHSDDEEYPYIKEFPYIKDESLAGAWYIKIINEDKWEDGFKNYLEIVYGDDALLTTIGSKADHIKEIIVSITKYKNYISLILRKKRDEKTGKIEEIANPQLRKFCFDLYKLIPHVPISGTKIIPNHGDIRPLSTSSFVYKLIQKDGSLQIKVNGEEPQIANGPFCFVIPTGGKEILLGARAHGGHTVLSRGGDVYFAGEVEFKNGEVLYWNNSSGHYLPPKEQASIMQELGLSELLPISKYVNAF